MAQTSENGQCCELTYKKDLMKSMETLPQCGSFVNDREDKKEEKERYTASEEMKIHLRLRSCKNTSMQGREALHTMETYGKLCKSLFLKLSMRRYFKE